MSTGFVGVWMVVLICLMLWLVLMYFKYSENQPKLK